MMNVLKQNEISLEDSCFAVALLDKHFMKDIGKNVKSLPCEFQISAQDISFCSLSKIEMHLSLVGLSFPLSENWP